MPDNTDKRRQVHQIVGTDGSPYKAAVTSSLHVVDGFSVPLEGNQVKPYICGKDYFSDLIKDIAGATESIYIAGWQVNWDAQLAPGKRLYDVLLSAAKAKPRLKIYVMPWDDSPPVQTYDDQTKSALESINDTLRRGVEGKQVYVQLSASVSPRNRDFYSHHQKQVVIDRKIGYVGGIDLAYGRYDDAQFTLRADADGRKGLNRYNACVAPVGKVTDGEVEVVDPDLMSGPWDTAAGVPYLVKTNKKIAREAIERGAYQKPYSGNIAKDKPGVPLSTTLDGLDVAIQPRQPWNDVEVRIEGPAVAELTRNFVSRWNHGAKKDFPKLTNAEKPVQGKGGCVVQVLRSAPPAMCDSGKTQSDHLQAMRLLIDHSTHFIYIENQFFVSNFSSAQVKLGSVRTIDGAQSDWNPSPSPGPGYVGPGAEVYSMVSAKATRWGHDGDDEGIQNDICQCIGDRIRRAIFDNPDGEPFHVYITLPVHPEGKLNDGAVLCQVHWTMQTLVFGRFSLLNRIRRHLWAKREFDANKGTCKTVKELASLKAAVCRESETTNDYQKIDVEDGFQYVTLLNLRNWTRLGQKYVTEQIYVHSKLMIVDDRYALLGSANINDRSLLGDRDSELGVLILDTKQDSRDVLDDGRPRLVRNFAHHLRVAVWEKIFGLNVANGGGGVQQATELRSAIQRPGNPNSWKSIQKVARDNANVYEAVFPFVPRNFDSSDSQKDTERKRGASIWPVYHRGEKNERKGADLTLARTRMPFDSEFWKAPPLDEKQVAELGNIKGFATLFPYAWTKGENNDVKLNYTLVTEGDPLPTKEVPDEKNAAPRPVLAAVGQLPNNGGAS